MKGISPGAALVFLMTGPATNAAGVAMVWKMLGKRTAVTYLATVAVTALISGMLLNMIYSASGASHMHEGHWMLPHFVNVASAVILLLVLAAWDRVPLAALVLVLGLSGWAAPARLVRAEVLRLRGAEFVAAARALGAPLGRILLRHLLPNAAGPLIVAASLGVGDVILLEAGLSFLGLGVRPPTPSLGGMILDAREVLATAPWASLFPGLALVAIVLGTTLLGDALRTALDPREA